MRAYGVHARRVTGSVSAAGKLPCGTMVKLRYHGRSVTVPVIDRGPYVAGRDYDLTEAVKRKPGFPGVGTVLASPSKCRQRRGFPVPPAGS